ncbi:hypothetical protein ACFXO9_13995 [Nocardia tengchongensis]
MSAERAECATEVGRAFGDLEQPAPPLSAAIPAESRRGEHGDNWADGPR